MDPLTAGAIAFLTLLSSKALDKTSDVLVDKALEEGGKVMKLLKHKSPETAGAIEVAAQRPELAAQQREDYGEAVLVEQVEAAAKADPEIREAVEAVAYRVDEAAKTNPEIKAAVQEFTKAVEAQRQSIQNITNTDNKSYGNVTLGGSVSIEKQEINQTF